jgi:cobalamin biosynthesis protein CobT
MGVFGFIENFFFISLGIAFALVLLLVYHFKNRMSVAEKKSETMYGLLASVVREIKSLRSMFLPSSAAPQKEASLEKDEQLKGITKKSDPEVQVSVGPESEVITVNLVSSPTNVKIVVSDEEDDDEDEEDEESDVSDKEEDAEDDDEGSEPEESDKESGNESESESDSEEEEELRVEDLGSEIILDSVVPVNEPEEPTTVDLSFASEEPLESFIPAEKVEVAEDKLENPKQTHSVDQLKKMNINQLKTIAIQSGITVDTSKLKKHDLITLIVDA